MDPLDERNLAMVYQHAEQTYPKECCGFVHFDGQVHEGVNIQDELHARSPEVYQRIANYGYTFSVADTVLLNNSFRTDNPVAVIYHSHPDVGAYFSREDIDKALYDAQPIYPVQYLVVDVKAGKAKGAKLFEWRNGQFATAREFVV
ncbi:Mov34/MPN/PAD-1 family protein [Burkholderia stabilis]|uniref:Mov34/MPN/PAD-1 family protein n=1 Tax=Burkholderia stabilis TaxID=95485 RepID=UPI000A66F0FD|nr:Mov34/MPN/PAD-1 family protein [Burkholderia stabilis]